MLNSGLKKEALTALQNAQNTYASLCSDAQKAAEILFKARQSSSDKVIPEVEGYINSLANTPKEFDKTFAAYRAEFKVFSNLLHDLEVEAKAANFKAGSTAAAGIAAGVGTAAFAPTAAMAIATTFGTASTGTAISALSGAAATNAALAWLGGGALVAGGGGMSGGSALLALAGPVGWAIGGAALVGGGLFARSTNSKIAEEANHRRKELEVHIRRLNAALQEIRRVLNLTQQHVQGVKVLLERLVSTAPNDYSEFSASQREGIGSLVNHVRSLSALLNKKVDVK